MTQTVYTNYYEINDLQREIVSIIDTWVHVEKTPIARKEIIRQMKKKGTLEDTTIYSLKILLKKGFIRRAYTISNKTTYVQLKRL